MRILAIDLGASSGRAIIGSLDEAKKLTLEELYRFPNGGIKVGNSLYWDFLRLFQEIKNSLHAYVQKYGKKLDSIGIDTWGVDFVLLDENNELIGPVHHYRDHRTDGMVEKMTDRVPKEEIFKQTGIQFMFLNSSTQLYSMIYQDSPRLKITRKFLMLPDYFHYLLSGVIASEFSDATTSQLYNPIEKDWAFDLIKKLGGNPEWFQKIIPGGILLGPIRRALAEEVGLSPATNIIAPLTHDTGSAYVAVPVEMNQYSEGEYGILSSGTWSLLGAELKEPLINEKALKFNYTNEGGINGTIRFLKNITGLWLIQECKRIWDKEELNLKWDEIEREAEQAASFRSLVNPDDHSFANPENMIESIEEYCRSTSQEFPATVGALARTIFESLALRYKQAVQNLEEILGKKLKVLHIIGGGSQNALLNQFTSNALGIPVKAGPTEATAIGNILVQALALGEIADLAELRKIVSNSFDIKTYIPTDSAEWERAYKKYTTLVK